MHSVIGWSQPRAASSPSDDPNLVTVAGDIADPATARRVINEAVSRFGRVDTLINNAGIFIAKPFTALKRVNLVHAKPVSPEATALP